MLLNFSWNFTTTNSVDHYKHCANVHVYHLAKFPSPYATLVVNFIGLSSYTVCHTETQETLNYDKAMNDLTHVSMHCIVIGSPLHPSLAISKS